MGHASAVGGVTALLAITGAATPAHAYTIDTVVTSACHEPMTMQAIRNVRAQLPTAGPVQGDRDDRALVNDAPFDPDADMRELAAVTIVLGNRDIDIEGHDPTNTKEVSISQADPDKQMYHCLRAPWQDGPNGSLAALDSCKDFIRQRVSNALEGLDAHGQVDLSRRKAVNVYLEMRGRVTAWLPVYYFEIGRALHTLQDSFSHTYRTPDGLRVTVVLNYVDEIRDDLEEPIDGPPHKTGLDRCDDPDELRKQRRLLAIEASTALLRATLDPALDREQKLAAVDDVLETYVGYSPGCTFENDWCDAPENAIKDDSGCVCTSPAKAAPAPGGWAGGLLLVGLWIARRRKQLAGALVATSLFGASPAKAQEQRPAQQPAAGAQPSQEPQANVEVVNSKTGAKEPNAVVIDTSPTTDVRKPSAWGLHVAFGFSMQEEAFAASVGLRWRVNRHLLLGADGEWNPFVSFRDRDVQAGVLNFYGTAVARVPLKFQRVNLRSSFHVGVSRLMFDLYAAPEGSVGPFLGFSLLGIDYEVSPSIYIVVDPANVAIPVPQLEGVPFSYPQYRFTLGLQFGA